MWSEYFVVVVIEKATQPKCCQPQKCWGWPVFFVLYAWSHVEVWDGCRLEPCDCYESSSLYISLVGWTQPPWRRKDDPLTDPVCLWCVWEREREFARHIHWLSLLSELCWLLLTLTAWTSLTLPYTSFLWHFENLLWSKYPQTNALSSPLVLCLRGRTGVVLTQGLQGISIFRQSIKVI